ncbi:hypothetical protein [Enhygromyxa salina]|uniref:hypothetical protein n=1 Tax=Enhygromyxa salina TaxID=215803 RepID=UPI000D03D9E1|nr:hypothetical protein [Enhygromyxa salina]
MSFVTRPHVVGDTQADFDDILYNVLDVTSVGEAESARESVTSSASDPSAAWSPYVLLEFPTEVAPAAMRVIAAPVPGLDGDRKPNTTAIATRPGAAVRAVSVGDDLFLFRQTKGSANDTVYIDRFRFDLGQLRLVPARESRFARSQRADVPASDQDSLDVRAPDGGEFVAATVALSLDAPIDDGFAVVLVPSADDSGNRYWHLFVGACTSTTSAATIGSGPRACRPRSLAPRKSCAGNLLTTLGLGASRLQRQYYHDLVMVYVQALLAEGTSPTPV